MSATTIKVSRNADVQVSADDPGQVTVIPRIGAEHMQLGFTPDLARALAAALIAAADATDRALADRTPADHR